MSHPACRPLIKLQLYKGNGCTFDRNHKQRRSSFSAPGGNSSISSYAKTYVINVCSAACSICASVFLASPCSLCQHGTAEGPSWSERAERGGDGEEDNASARASAPTCEPLTCVLAVKDVFCFSRVQLSLFLRATENKYASFRCRGGVTASPRGKKSQSQEDGIHDKRHKSLKLCYPSRDSFKWDY